jgi:hypothetical protein
MCSLNMSTPLNTKLAKEMNRAYGEFVRVMENSEQILKLRRTRIPVAFKDVEWHFCLPKHVCKLTIMMIGMVINQ